MTNKKFDGEKPGKPFRTPRRDKTIDRNPFLGPIDYVVNEKIRRVEQAVIESTVGSIAVPAPPPDTPLPPPFVPPPPPPPDPDPDPPPLVWVPFEDPVDTVWPKSGLILPQQGQKTRLAVDTENALGFGANAVYSHAHAGSSSYDVKRYAAQFPVNNTVTNMGTLGVSIVAPSGFLEIVGDKLVASTRTFSTSFGGPSVHSLTRVYSGFGTAWTNVTRPGTTTNFTGRYDRGYGLEYYQVNEEARDSDSRLLLNVATGTHSYLDLGQRATSIFDFLVGPTHMWVVSFTGIGVRPTNMTSAPFMPLVESLTTAGGDVDNEGRLWQIFGYEGTLRLRILSPSGASEVGTGAIDGSEIVLTNNRRGEIVGGNKGLLLTAERRIQAPGSTTFTSFGVLLLATPTSISIVYETQEEDHEVTGLTVLPDDEVVFADRPNIGSPITPGYQGTTGTLRKAIVTL